MNGGHTGCDRLQRAAERFGFTVVSNSTFRLNAANVFTANHATLMQNAG